MNQAASELYQSTVLDHNRSPRGYGELSGTTHSAEGFNPICGDRVKIQVIVGQGAIKEIKFTAQCCALCRASASVLTEVMGGQPLSFAKSLSLSFQSFIQGDAQPAADLAKSAASAFFAIKDYPARAKCVLLPWHTLSSSLTDQLTVSTEPKE